MKAAELKGWIETGFQGIRTEIAGLGEKIDRLEKRADRLDAKIEDLRTSLEARMGSFEARMDSLEARIEYVHTSLADKIEQVRILYEDLRHNLQFLEEGESPRLAHRVSALEVRLDSLEHRRRK